MSARAAALIAAALLAGCGGRETVRTVRVEVPVDRPVLPPAELLSETAQPPREWLEPLDPRASSCLSSEAEDQLKRYIGEHRARDAAMRSWADRARSPGPPR